MKLNSLYFKCIILSYKFGQELCLDIKNDKKFGPAGGNHYWKSKRNQRNSKNIYFQLSLIVYINPFVELGSVCGKVMKSGV